MLRNTLGAIIKILLTRKRNNKKKERKEMLIKLFGKARYYLSVWFGEWVLFAFNKRDYSTYDPKPYQKFYRDEQIAMRYAKRLQNKYKKVEITKVYNAKKQHIGYMLTGYVKVEQPDNVISIKKAHV